MLACALDAGGWRVLQANAAAVLAAGLAPGDLEAGGLPFWQLFDPPPPAPRSNCFVDLDALQQQAERRQAFWLACKLLPPDQRAADGFANGGLPAPTLRRRSADLRRCSSDSASSGGGGGGAGPSSFDSQGSAKPSRDPEQLWDVCFEPCAVPPPAPGPQLLFTATLHPANIGATMAAARLGLLDARQEPAAPLGGGELSGGLELLPSQLLRPQSMEGVVLGGLLGRGASGK